jgi:uncharacterized RDD family membrane protein YckC
MPRFATVGLFRRALALLVDSFTTVTLALLILFLPGLFVPFDRSLNWAVLLLFPLVLAFGAYTFIGYVYLPNTYGRYLMGIRVLDERSGGRPSLSQALRRGLAAGFWPLEAALVALNERNKRLGDLWAHTVVAHYSPHNPLWKRLLPGLLVAIGACVFFVAGTPAINGRMEINRVAAQYVRQQLRTEPSGPANSVTIVNDSGTVTMRLRDGRSVRIHLVQVGETWNAKRVEEIGEGELGHGFSIQQGGDSASDF